MVCYLFPSKRMIILTHPATHQLVIFPQWKLAQWLLSTVPHTQTCTHRTQIYSYFSGNNQQTAYLLTSLSRSRSVYTHVHVRCTCTQIHSGGNTHLIPLTSWPSWTLSFFRLLLVVHLQGLSTLNTHLRWLLNLQTSQERPFHAMP